MSEFKTRSGRVSRPPMRLVPVWAEPDDINSEERTVGNLGYMEERVDLVKAEQELQDSPVDDFEDKSDDGEDNGADLDDFLASEEDEDSESFKRGDGEWKPKTKCDDEGHEDDEGDEDEDEDDDDDDEMAEEVDEDPEDIKELVQNAEVNRLKSEQKTADEEERQLNLRREFHAIEESGAYKHPANIIPRPTTPPSGPVSLLPAFDLAAYATHPTLEAATMPSLEPLAAWVDSPPALARSDSFQDVFGSLPPCLPQPYPDTRNIYENCMEL